MLAFQPVLLAMLASGVLPVSNLTNLIAASRLSLTSADFLANLALPSVAASTVGWFVYRRVFPARADGRPRRGAAIDRRALAIGGSAIALFLVLLVGGEHVGVPAWVAALVTVGFLVGVHTVVAVAPGAGRHDRARGRARGRRRGRRGARSRICSTSAGDGGLRGFGTGVLSRPTCSTTCPRRS